MDSDKLQSFVACPVAVIGLDDRNNVDLWNPAAAALFGWPPDEIAGKPLPSALEALDRVGGGASATVTVTARTGRSFSVESRAGRRKTGGRVIVVTALSAAATQERAAASVSKPGKRFRELLAAIPDAIVEVNREGRIVLCNHAAEQIFGYTRDELLCESVAALLPAGIAGHRAEAGAPWWAKPFRRPMGRGPLLRGLRKDGSTFPAEIGLSPVRVAGELRITAVIRDVTARESAGEAVRANASNSEFLADMSRELRTPLHTILGFTELLQEGLEGPLNAKQTRFVGQVHRDALELLDLVNNIADLNKTDLNPESLDAAEVVAEVVTGMGAAAEARGIAIENCIEAPLSVFADPGRFRQIVGNLVDHAIRSSRSGGSIRLEHAGDGRITVIHEGSGISGLALAVVKRLVAMQGGEVYVESAPDSGTRSTFSVPAPKPGRF